MRRSITALLTLTLAANPIAAQGIIDEVLTVGPDRASPSIERIESNVQVTIDGRIAHFEVTERFRNTGRGIAEGSYLYPLPRDAVFGSFSLFQGEQELRGEMMSAAEARAIYEEIVRKLRDPALLTLAGHGLIRAQVFPIQPGETRTVVLRYTELLKGDDGALRIRHAAGNRGTAPMTMTVVAPDADRFATVYSPTHSITSSRAGGSLRITVTPPMAGDVDLILPFRQRLAGGTVLTHASGDGDGFALIMLAPADSAAASTVPRDLTLVVDVSGSMSGGKIAQAKAALHQALQGLRPDDRFRLIAFSNSVRTFTEGYSRATPANLRRAGSYVDALNATGGTNLSGAISTALAEPATSGRLAIVLLLTDGLPSVGERAPDKIAAQAASEVDRRRIFTVGIGQDVNTYLLDRLAVEGKGSATYVSPGADVADAVGGVITRIAHPALIDLKIVRSPVRLDRQAPATLPDLFYGEELVVLARYSGSGSGPMVIEGTRNGRRERFEIAANFPRHQNDNEYLAQLWAARRIGELTRTIRLEGSSPELIDEVRELGLKYGILTEYSSYLVQEPGMLANGTTPVVVPAGAAAAREMTGMRAFEAAKASASMSGSNNLAAADQLVDRRAAAIAQAPVVWQDGSSRSRVAPSLKRSGGRLFVQCDGAWVDAAHDSTAQVVTLAPYSRAYFDLIEARPNLAAALAIGDRVTVAGNKISLKIAASGISEWQPGQLARFLQRFGDR